MIITAFSGSTLKRLLRFNNHFIFLNSFNGKSKYVKMHYLKTISAEVSWFVSDNKTNQIDFYDPKTNKNSDSNQSDQMIQTNNIRIHDIFTTF